MAKSTEPSLRGFSAKVRTPRNMGANPPVQVMLSQATTPDTLGVNARSMPGTRTLNFSPSRIWPSMPATVEFQRGKSFASVRRFHILSAPARILTSTPQAIEKAPGVFVTLGSFMASSSLEPDISSRRARWACRHPAGRACRPLSRRPSPPLRRSGSSSNRRRDCHPVRRRRRACPLRWCRGPSGGR